MQHKPLINVATMRTIEPVQFTLGDYFTGWRLALAAGALALIVLGVAL